MNNKAIAYLRHSNSAAQRARGLSILDQKRQIEEYSKRSWVEVIEMYIEEKSAFKKVWAREVFNKMLRDIKTKPSYRWIKLIQFSFDRLSRNLKEWQILIEVTEKYWIELVSLSEPNFSATPESNYYFRDITSRAILYSELLSYKVKIWCYQGFLEMEKHWHISGLVKLPIGYIYDKQNRRALLDEENKTIIDDIFKMYLSWRFSYRSIIRDLKTRWIEKIWNKTISKNIIERLLTNEIYSWIYKVNWNIKPYEVQYYPEAKEAGIFTKKYRLNIPQYITEEEFKIIQRIREKRTQITKVELKTKNRKKKRYYIFNWLLKCECWRQMCWETHRWINYYRCTKNITSNFPEKCNSKTIREDKIYLELMERLEDYSFTKPKLNKLEKEITKYLWDFKLIKQKRELELKKELEEILDKKLKLTDKYIDEKINDDTYEKMVKIIEDKEIDLKIEEKNLKHFELEQLVFDKFFSYIKELFTLIKGLKSYFTVGVNPKTRTVLKEVYSNSLVGTKKGLTFAVNPLLDFVRNDFVLLWSEMQDSNLQPRAPKARALANCANFRERKLKLRWNLSFF